MGDRLQRLGRLAERASLQSRLGPATDRPGLERLDVVAEMLGRAEIARLAAGPALAHIRDYGVRIFSQWDEDGIIAYLLDQLRPVPRTFVEFGVGDYRESNTRFLVRQGEWAGVIIEADPGSCAQIKKLQEMWRYDLRLVEAFISAESINDLIGSAGCDGEIGLLSIDVDGNDYWIWKAVTVVTPAIVVIEFNGRFGDERRVSIPYDPSFRRMAAHPSGVYYGASLPAMVSLGQEKGYDYVGSNTADSNAFFVRSDLRPSHIPALSAREGFRPARVREMRRDGRLVFATPEEESEVLRSLPLVEV
jgi:hypothetical protein